MPYKLPLQSSCLHEQLIVMLLQVINIREIRSRRECTSERIAVYTWQIEIGNRWQNIAIITMGGCERAKNHSQDLDFLHTTSHPHTIPPLLFPLAG